jgi:hypothetical protein
MSTRLKSAAEVWEFVRKQAASLGAGTHQHAAICQLDKHSVNVGRDPLKVAAVSVALNDEEQILDILLQEVIDGDVVANGKWININIESDGYTTIKSSQKTAVIASYLS